MRNLFILTFLSAITGFIFSGNTYAESNSAEKYSIPDELDVRLENFGLNDSEIDEASVENRVLVIMFDSEKLNLNRAYKTISLICNFTKEYPRDWQGREFNKIAIMDFLQSNTLIFHGGIKNCLHLPINAKIEQIKPYTEVKRNYQI